MKRTFSVLCFLIFAVLMTGCAVMSPQLRNEAVPAMPFADLIRHSDVYKGKTVILGGYVASVENKGAESRIIALQTPLGIGEEPGFKDQSEGRLILLYKGFIDPQVYAKDRRITVGGEVLGGSVGDPNAEFPYIKLQVREIYLWPIFRPAPPDPFWYDDWYPYPVWRDYYWHRHYWHYPYGRYPYW
jgi:outer membrane lipoprotein